MLANISLLLTGIPVRKKANLSDGSGGALVLFSNGSTGMVQHISAVGAGQWADPVWCTDNLPLSGSPMFISDGQGGAVLSWDVYDYDDPLNNRAIYVQIVAADGILRLGSGGLHIGNKPYSGQGDRTSLVGDGSGGFIAS